MSLQTGTQVIRAHGVRSGNDEDGEARITCSPALAG